MEALSLADLILLVQVGVTPENTETALLAHDRHLQQLVANMPAEARPVQPSLPDP